MGRLDRERQRAIEVQLKEMDTTIEEVISEAISLAETENAREIELDFELHRRANAIMMQIKQQGISPAEWAAQQPYSIETSKLHSMLEEKWIPSTVY